MSSSSHGSNALSRFRNRLGRTAKNDDKPSKKTDDNPSKKTNSEQRAVVQARPAKSGYAPLKDSAIRLVKFEKKPADREEPEVYIRTFEINEAPSYLALSYWWGNPETSTPILVDGESFNVSMNLYQALKHISALSARFEEGLAGDSNTSTELYLWIDALCINQRDMNEKARVVPRMTQIYSNAFTVLVWMGSLDFYGKSDQMEGPRMFGLKVLVSHLEMNAPLRDFKPMPWEVYQKLGMEIHLGGVVHAMYRAYITVLMNPWFNRAWTIQERMVSKRDPCVVLGYAMFSLRSLHAAMSDFEALGKIDYRPIRVAMNTARRRLEQIVNDAFGNKDLQSELTSPDFRAKPLAERLLTILLGVKGDTTIPHDQVYALMGMIDLTHLPPHLAVDYRQPYSKMCRDITRYLIENTRDLRILSFSQEHELDDDSPSWAMDLRYREISTEKPAVLHTGHFTEDGRGLVVEGLRLGFAECTVHSTPTFEPESPGSSFSEQGAHRAGLSMMLLRSFHDTIIVRAAGLRKEKPSIVWKEWFSSFLEENCGYPYSHGQRYDSAQEFLDDRLTVGPSGRIRHEKNDVNGIEVLLDFIDKQFILLHDGTIVQCVLRSPPSTEATYLFAFKGSVYCSFVRELPSGEMQLAGSLRRHLSNGYRLNEEFFTSRAESLEKITLM